MLLNDCSTEFMKHVLPKLRSPTTLRNGFFFVGSLVPFASAEIVRFRGRNLRTALVVGVDGPSHQPESLDDVLADSCCVDDFIDDNSSSDDDASDEVSSSLSS